MASAPGRVRACALIAFGALVVHQLRFILEFEGDWQSALAEQGHGYLTLIVPLVVLALVAAAVLFSLELRRTGCAGPPAVPRRSRSFWVSWLLTAGILSAIYTGQELTEGFLATGHPVGLSAIVGGDGWTAFVIAFAVAGVVALLLRRAKEAVERAAHAKPLVFQVLLALTVTLPVRHSRPLEAVARHLAGRGPPITS